jgi:hypothetical protein
MKKIISLLMMSLVGLVGTYAWAGSGHEDTVERMQKSVDVLTRLIHIFEDNKGLLCYKHVVKTMFAATKEASECLKIAQHSVCCSQEFFASL